jgi:AcrR family transcriptional regulator
MTDASRPRVRRPRADALRNYERLLDEADTAFREQGTGASLEGVARRAGVAIGTLYGHFPNRRALAAALLRERHTALFEVADALPGHSPPAEALGTWMRAVAVHAAAYRGLAEMLISGLADDASELHDACARLDATTERLLAEARDAGAVRPDITAADIHTLMNAGAWLRTQVPEPQADHLLSVVVAGLQAEPGTP